MPLKDFNKTTGYILEWTKYRIKFVAKLTVNGHQHVIYKAFKVPDTIYDPIKYSKYKIENYLVLIGIGLGLFNISFSGGADKNRIDKDGR